MDKEDRRVPGLSLKPPTPDKSRALSGNPFMKGDLVSVTCDNAGSDGTTSQFVVNGVVRDVFENVNVMGKDCNSAIGVVEMSSDSKELGYIKWNGKAYDAIPDTEYGRVKMICKGYEELTSDQKRTFSVLRSHVRMRKDPGAPMLDSEFDKFMLDEEGLCYVIRKLSQKADSNELIHTVTDGDRDCAMYLAYLFARMTAAEIGASVKSALEEAEIRSRGDLILEALNKDVDENRSPSDRLKSLNCPLLSVFALTLLTSLYRDSPEKGVFRPHFLFCPENESRLAKIVSKIETIMAILTSSTHGRKCSSAVIGPAAKGLINSVHLQLENSGGISDKLMQSLHEQGIAWGPSMVRDAIRDAVDSIPMGNCRKNTPAGFVDINVHTADNSDTSTWRQMVNCIVMATIKVGEVPYDVYRAFSASFRNGFPHYFTGLGTKLMPTAADDNRVLKVVHGQNVQAMLIAAASQNQGEKKSSFESTLVQGVYDGGGRHRIPAATTVHTALADNLSTKNSEVTRTVLEKISAMTPDFMKNPQLFTCDQELIPTAFKLFFLSIAASAVVSKTYTLNDGPRPVRVACGLMSASMPLIIVIGNGHAIKNLCSSIFRYHRKWLYEPVLISLGFSPGSASFSKIENVTYIRNGTKTIFSINEALRISYAKKYLDLHGHEGRISLSGATESAGRHSPCGLLGKYMAMVNGKGRLPSGHRKQLILTPSKRPAALVMTGEMDALSLDFIKFARGLENDPSGSDLFGPSGYMRRHQEDYLSEEGELFAPLQIDERYADVFTYPWKTRHGRVGLTELCKDAGIYDVAPGRSRQALARRLYEYRRAGGGEAGIEAARQCVGMERRYHRPPMPNGVCIHAKLANGLLFGAEGTAMLLCILCSRVQEPDKDCPFDNWPTPKKRCEVCNGTENCSKVTWGDKRLKLSSYVGMVEDESHERSNPPLGRRRPLSSAERSAEESQLSAAVRATDTIVANIIQASQSHAPNEFVLGTRLRFADLQGTYYRELNAYQKAYEAGIATIQGFQSGLVIKPPKFPHSIPQSLVVAKKRVQRDKSVQRDEGELLKIARATGNLAITPNNSAFGGKKGLKKCGTNKAKMTEEIVREIGNKAVVLSEEDFGYVPSEQARRPIMLFKHESNADEWLNTGTSLLCLVDGLKDMQERPLGRPGGAAQATTVIECARQILYWAVKQYVKEGVSMVVVFWDVESTSPCERDIQRRKRSKDQSQASSFAAAMNGADFNTPLDHLGTWDFLRDHGKATFMPFLASAVAEAMSVDEGNWSFGELLPPRVAFAFVGGTEPSQRRVYRGPTAHPEESINLMDEVSIEANVVDDILSNAAHQGEAERMLFFFQDRILDHTATNTTEGLAVSTSFDVHCEDTDAVADIAAPFILRQQARFRRANMKYSGRIMLRIHNKSDSFANHMGTLVQERDGSRVLGTASGEQLVCYFDLLAMYHFFEKDNRLPEFGETGHRAVSVLTATYVMTNTDYTYSLITPSEVLCGLKSEEFKSNPERLVNLRTDQSFEEIGDVQYLSKGMWRLFRAMIINLERTNGVLTQKLSNEVLRTCLDLNSAITWAHIRGATVLGKERYIAPDMVSFVAYLSIAQVTLHRWIAETYVDRPVHGIDSLANTCYNVPSSATEDWEVKWKVEMTKELRLKLLREGATESNIDAVISSQYSGIAKDLDPSLRTAIERACTNRDGLGESPVDIVPMEEYRLECLATSLQQLDEYLSKAGTNYTNRARIYEHTICGCTTFKVKGYPKLKTKTALQVSTGTHLSDPQVPPIVDWGAFVDLKDSTIETLFLQMERHATRPAAAQLADQTLHMIAVHLLPRREIANANHSRDAAAAMTLGDESDDEYENDEHEQENEDDGERVILGEDSVGEVSEHEDSDDEDNAMDADNSP